MIPIGLATRRVLPYALAGLVLYRFLPYGYDSFVWGVSFALIGGTIVLWTPYLMIAALCFYIMSQLPFPRSLAFEAWGGHALLLGIVVIVLWRTWILWPEWAGPKKKTVEKKDRAPWWGYVIGGILASGLFALMAYVFHFQDT